MYRVNDYLTPSERLDAMRVGGMRKLASVGLTPKTFTDLVKKADGPASALDLLGTALRTSVFIGAPLGALWFAMRSGLGEDNKKTRKLKETLDHYNDVVANNRGQMAISQARY